MLPVTAINVSQVQVPLINTVTPGTTVTHVPYDNVAPSVSSAQVDNNASSNNNAVASAAPQPSPTPDAAAQNFYAALASGTASTAPNAQATFLAQLIAQDVSPPAQTILLQYEAMVAISNVKYKPSNAMKPEPAPSGVFSQILHQEKAPSVEPLPPVQPTAPTAEETAATATRTAAPVELPPPAPKPAKSYAGTYSGSDAATTAAQVTNAYAEVASRPAATARSVKDSA